jgi:hypothetical protein
MKLVKLLINFSSLIWKLIVESNDGVMEEKAGQITNSCPVA